MVDTITIISLATGIIGSLTGATSLIWHLKNNKPRLKLETAYFKKHGFHGIVGRGREEVGVRIRLRNLSNNPTTIEEIYIEIGNIFQKAPDFKETEIPKHSSKTFEYELDFDEQKFEELFDDKGKIQFGIFIDYTHGKLKKRMKTSFSTGHFSMR